MSEVNGLKVMSKLKILFLCTGNSCRSQIAEGWARSLKGDCIEAYSAGIETHGMNPNVVAVMAEAGVDISSQRSKHLDEVRDIEFDYVVTGEGEETFPQLVSLLEDGRTPSAEELAAVPNLCYRDGGAYRITPRRLIPDIRPLDQPA